MNYRTTLLLAEETGLTAGTKTIPINVKDIISRIALTWTFTRVGEGMDLYNHKIITKIELVDGSDVLHSLDGGQNQALCIYDRKCPTMDHGQHLAQNSDFSVYGIDFGRHLFDPELAFDPKQFRNPQLKVTYDHDVSDSGAASGALEVWAECFDEKVVSPVGFLMSKNHHSYTLSGTGYEYIDLPTDYPIRKMLIQGYLKDVEPWSQVAEARLSEDNDKRVPFDWTSLEDYFRLMKGVWTPVEEPLIGWSEVGGSAYYVTPTDYWATVYALARGANEAIGVFTSTCKGGLVTLASTNGVFFLGRVSGFLPNHCFEFPFGDPKDVTDWYDVTKIGSLILRLRGASGSTGVASVVLQQLRRY